MPLDPKNGPNWPQLGPIDPQSGSIGGVQSNYWPQSNGSIFNFRVSRSAEKLDWNPFAAQNAVVRAPIGCSGGQKNFASLSGWRSDWRSWIARGGYVGSRAKKSRCLANWPAQRFFEKEHPAGGVSERLPSNFLDPPHRAKRERLKKRLGTLSEHRNFGRKPQESHYKVWSHAANVPSQRELTVGGIPNGPNRPFFIDWRPIEPNRGRFLASIEVQSYKICKFYIKFIWLDRFDWIKHIDQSNLLNRMHWID